MAKKYESEIDPDEFIRSFREESSGLSSYKRSTTETKNSDAQSPTESVKVQAESTLASTDVSDATINDYRRRFISDSTYLRSRRRFLMVEIDPDFVQKIKRIISFESDSPCSIKSYVNNVLADHFERYKAIIEKRL